MKKFEVIVLMFAQSDLESRLTLYAKDEDDARVVCERVYPSYIFKSAKEIA